MTRKNTHPQRGKAAIDRFAEKIDKSGDCWEWTSAKQGAGYGVFWVGGGKSVNAHRFAWESANKSTIPAGMVVMHSCNNKGCVNPAHLSIGTPRDNSAAAVRDGLAPAGERNKGGGKLTAAQARQIFNNNSEGCHRLGRLYGVSKTTILAIKRGRIWKCATHATA